MLSKTLLKDILILVLQNRELLSDCAVRAVEAS